MRTNVQMNESRVKCKFCTKEYAGKGGSKHLRNCHPEEWEGESPQRIICPEAECSAKLVSLS